MMVLPAIFLKKKISIKGNNILIFDKKVLTNDSHRVIIITTDKAVIHKLMKGGK